MSDDRLIGPVDAVETGTASELPTAPTAATPGSDPSAPKKKKKKKRKKSKSPEEKRFYEAGAVIVCDGKVALRLTDKQRWIFPKGKIKRRESPADAARREATEETGLAVEIIEPIADLLIRHEGKKRRFAFFLMRATAKTWDWPHHEGRDTFLIAPDQVTALVRHAGYAKVWQACQERVRSMCDEPTPFVAHQVRPADQEQPTGS